MTVRFTAVRENYALTRNNVYDVLESSRDKYYVRNDRGVVAGYVKTMFQVVDNDNTVAEDAPEAPRRRGRPTNAEIAARQNNETTVNNANAAAEERARVAREAELARRAEENRVRAENQRVRTDAEIIQSINHVVEIVPIQVGIGVNTNIGNTITVDFRRHVGDDPLIVTINPTITVRTNQAYSCGILQISGVESTLNIVLQRIPFNVADYEDVTREILRLIFQTSVESLQNGAGIHTMSITTRNPRHISLISENTDFNEVSRATNRNSNNVITVFNRIVHTA